MKIAIREKNELIIRQTRRITLLEAKMTELRKSYMKLKYADILVHLKASV